MIMKCSSKKLQVLKQISGRSYQLFMMLMATFAGTSVAGITSWWTVFVTGAIAMLLQGISSQLDFYQNKEIIREELISIKEEMKQNEKNI